MAVPLYMIQALRMQIAKVARVLGAARSLKTLSLST